MLVKLIALPVMVPVWLLMALLKGFLALTGGPVTPTEVASLGHTPRYPKCVTCGGRDFQIVTKPTFTVDRFSRQRIACYVDCLTCGLRLRMMRGEGDKDWSFLLQG